MILITEFGRIDRAAVTARAQEIYYASGAQMKWGDARGQAYREAAHQLSVVRRSMIAITSRTPSTVLGAG